MHDKNSMDFSAFIREEHGAEKTNRKRFPLWLPLAATALLVFVLWLVFSLLERHADRRMAIVGESVIGTAVPRGDFGEQAGIGADDIIAVEQAYSAERGLTTDVLNAVMNAQPDDLEILGLHYSSHEIVLDCRSERELCGADFAQLLRRSPHFSNIGYNGVVSVDNGYEFTITAQLGGKGE